MRRADIYKKFTLVSTRRQKTSMSQLTSKKQKTLEKKIKYIFGTHLMDRLEKRKSAAFWNEDPVLILFIL